jgi:hypothetical protein
MRLLFAFFLHPCDAPSCSPLPIHPMAFNLSVDRSYAPMILEILALKVFLKNNFLRFMKIDWMVFFLQGSDSVIATPRKVINVLNR